MLILAIIAGAIAFLLMLGFMADGIRSFVPPKPVKGDDDSIPVTVPPDKPDNKPLRK